MTRILISSVLVIMIFTSSYAQKEMQAGAQFGIQIPAGDLGDFVGVGFGGHGTFHYSLKPNLELTGLFGYYTYSDKNDIPGYTDYSYSDVPLLAGIRYVFPSASTFLPYVGAEIGLHFQSISFNFSDIDNNFLGSNLSSSETDFGFSPIAGFKYPLQVNLILDVNAKFNIISEANNFGIYAGLLWRLSH